MSTPIAAGTYVHHESGYWKVAKMAEYVSVWRDGEQSIETASFPADSLRVVSMDESSWADPADL